MSGINLPSLLEHWENSKMLTEYIIANPQYYDELMQYAFDDGQPGSWRAAWLADKIHDRYPDLIVPFLPQMVDFLQRSKNESKRRQFLKFLSESAIPEGQSGVLFDLCLNYLISASEPVAVRVFAMQVLYNISEQEPDLKPELIGIIEHELELHATPGILSRGRRLLKKLYQQTAPQIN
jgi:hypothetical protein